MDRERIEQIGKFLESKMVIHRNVEHNSTWTTEEKMIVDLYDNYLDLKIENNKQKEVIDKIKKLIKSKNNGTCIHNNERRGAYTFVLDFDEAREFVWNLEDILKEVSE